MILFRLFHTETKNLTISAFILAVATVGSAFLGLFRDRLLVGTFGAGEELDVYYAAFRIPDFIAMVLVMGAISAAIIPIFSSYRVHNPQEGWRFLSAILNVFLLFLTGVSLILFLLAPVLLSLIAPGFEGEKKEMAVFMTRIMFLSPILLGISNILSGALQVFHRFLITSLAPVFYNIGIIAGIFLFVPLMGISGLAWGVVFGALLHLLIQLPSLFKVGFRPRKVLEFSNPDVAKVFRLMAPRSLGLAASQINLIVITAIASTLTVGSITIFHLANSLSHLVVLTIAIAFSTAAFPDLSLAFSAGDRKDFSRTFSSALRQVLFFMIPLSILLFVLREQVVRIVFETENFHSGDARLTAAALGLFCLGVFAYGLVLLLSKVFYALQNTVTPAITSILAMMVNTGLAFLFVWLLKFPNGFETFIRNALGLQAAEHVALLGLPLAFSLAGISQLLLLSFFLVRRIGGSWAKELAQPVFKIVGSSMLMGAATFFVLSATASWFSPLSFWTLVAQTVLIGVVGSAVYLALVSFLGSSEMLYFWETAKSKLRF